MNESFQTLRKILEMISITEDNNQDFYLKYPELNQDDKYTSSASSLPLYELKLLQDYIHGENIKILGKQLPQYKKQLMLLKFFKHKKNQQVEVFSLHNQEVMRTVARVEVIGRDFVMLKTLFTRIWIPYHAIQSARTPFGIPDLPGGHQHLTYDEELRKKLLNNFGDTVSNREVLKQQFFEELFVRNLKVWEGTRVVVYVGEKISFKIKYVTKGILQASSGETYPVYKIQYMKQERMISFVQRVMKKLFQRRDTRE